MALQLQYNDRRRTFNIGSFLGVGLMLAWQYWHTERANSTFGMPPEEAKFVKIIMRASHARIDALNDLARNGMRAAPQAALCQANLGLSAVSVPRSTCSGIGDFCRICLSLEPVSGLQKEAS